jgi:hypothetical protein
MRSLGGNLRPIPNAVEGMICGKTIAPATATADRLTNSLLEDLTDIMFKFINDN